MIKAWFAFAFQPLVSTPIEYWLSVWMTSSGASFRRVLHRAHHGAELRDVVGAFAEVLVALLHFSIGRDDDDAKPARAGISRASAVCVGDERVLRNGPRGDDLRLGGL